MVGLLLAVDCLVDLLLFVTAEAPAELEVLDELTTALEAIELWLPETTLFTEPTEQVVSVAQEPVLLAGFWLEPAF